MGLNRRGAVTVAVALLVLVTFAGPLGGVVAQEGERTTEEDTIIRTSATGAAEAEPDRALVRVAVAERAETATAAREGIARNISSMREALAAINVSDEQIRTVSFFVDRDVDYTDDGREILRGYIAVQAFEIALGDVERAGEVIDTAVENGANRVDGVTFTLAAETRRDLRSEALARAMEDARADADAIAASGDLSITGIHSVETGEPRFIPATAQAFEAEAADARTVIDGGPVTVTATVTVTYNVTQG